MISNQSGLPSPAAGGLGTTPNDPTWLTPGKTGAASAFAALLGQLYQPQPVLLPIAPAADPVVTTAPESDAPVEPEAEVAPAVEAAALPATISVAGDAPQAAAQVAPQMQPVEPAVPVVFTPRAPRTVTRAIEGALNPKANSIATEAKFADLKRAPANAGSAKRPGEAGDDTVAASADASPSNAPQVTSAAMLAGAMLQSNVIASKSDTADAADTPTAEESSKAASATSNAANVSPNANSGGMGAASPMVRAMTLLLDALGVTDRSDRGAARKDAKVETTTETSQKQSSPDAPAPDLNTLPANAKVIAAATMPTVESKGKPDAATDALPGEKQAPLGAVVSQSAGGDSAASGQGEGRDHHDSRENVHRLHGDATSAAASSEQGPSGWSGTLGGALRQGIAATETSELGRAGATAHVPRSAPTAQPASTSQVTMDLDPTVGMLGKIRVAVRGETVHATITTQDSDAAALGVRAHELRLALEQRGFSDARVTVRSSGTEDAPASVIASSVSDLRPREASTASGKKDSETQQHPRGDRRDQTGGDRSDTRRQRNKQEQPQ